MHPRYKLGHYYLPTHTASTFTFGVNSIEISQGTTDESVLYRDFRVYANLCDDSCLTCDGKGPNNCLTC